MPKNLLLALAVVMCACGCNGPKEYEVCLGHGEKASYLGYRIAARNRFGGGILYTDCLPCSEATSPDARFVCTGLTYTAKPSELEK